MVALTSAATPASLIHEYLIEEDEIGDSTAQSRLLDYLTAVLRWLYHSDGWFVARDLTFYHPAIRNSQQLISPDIAVFKGIALTEDQLWDLTSWDMRPAKKGAPRREPRPCPPVVIEVSSQSTWRTDIGDGPAYKPLVYGLIGVREYFAYDPNRQPVWRNQQGQRLLGWRYDEQGQPIALAPDARGWLWSLELQSWLAPDEALLHLHDAQGRLRLTEAVATQAARQEAEAARDQLETRLAALRDLLKAHNIDPNSL